MFEFPSYVLHCPDVPLWQRFWCLQRHGGLLHFMLQLLRAEGVSSGTFTGLAMCKNCTTNGLEVEHNVLRMTKDACGGMYDQVMHVRVCMWGLETWLEDLQPFSKGLSNRTSCPAGCCDGWVVHVQPMRAASMGGSCSYQPRGTGCTVRICVHHALAVCRNRAGV